MRNQIMLEARKSKGMTQLDLALRAGIRREQISLLEHGLKPSRATAKKVARALGLAPDSIWPDYETFWRG